ncbi:MAG: hypothetical protein ACLVEF_06205 [Bifidobacterium bifidum]
MIHVGHRHDRAHAVLALRCRRMPAVAGTGQARIRLPPPHRQQTGFNPDGRDVRHDKTFVVFSGDLDKTIATVFIMARRRRTARYSRASTIFFHVLGAQHPAQSPKRVRVR